MLKALQSPPFLLILSRFIQITMYDFIQFSCFIHWNLHAVTIRLPSNPKASPANTNTDNLQFLLHANPAMLQVSLHGFRHASVCFSSVSWEEEKEWRKRIKTQSGHYVTTSIFQEVVLRKSSWGSCISRNSQLGALPHSRGRTSKSTHNWFSGSSKSSRSRKIPDYNIFKTQ